jgi:hypothetical protein
MIMKFVTIGYGDQAGYDGTETALLHAAHAHDARLRDGGAVMGIAGEPVQVRNHQDTGTTTRSGAFLRSDLSLAGFALIEAPTLADAIEMVSHSPCAIANGVVEVWPLND